MQTINTGMGLVEPEIDFISGDRRVKPRFELRLPLRYRMLNASQQAGSGMTRNLSSGGVAFEVTDKLEPGSSVELVIQWPVALRGTTPLELVVRGSVAWNQADVAAVRMTRTEFRGQRKASGAGGGFPLP